MCLVHTDHLNTPRLATNQQGQKVWGWEGEACGATAPTGSVTVNLRFPGQYYDAESGLHQNWNRYYDPKLCRFLTPDPRGIRAHVRRAMARLRQGGSRAPVELNPYAYVVNNPLRWADPFGLAITGTWVSIEAEEEESKMFYGTSVIGDTVHITVWGGGHLDGVVKCVDDCPKKEWTVNVQKEASNEIVGNATWRLEDAMDGWEDNFRDRYRGIWASHPEIQAQVDRWRAQDPTIYCR